MHRIMHLQPRFSIECHEAEIVGNAVVRYRIGIAVSGILMRADGAWHSSRAIVEGDVTYDEDADRIDVALILRPPTIEKSAAILLLRAAFESIDRGTSYEGGFVIILPIDLHDWLQKALPQTSVVAVECALRAAVLVNNAVLEN